MTNETQPTRQVVPWESFEIGTPEKEESKSKFPLIAPGLYAIECTNLEMVLGKKFQSEETQTQLEWSFTLLHNVAAPQTPILDTEGNPITKTDFPVWSQLYQTKIRHGEAQLTRAIATALLGVAVNVDLGEMKPERFIGKKCQIYIEIGMKSDNITPKNIFKKFTPLQ